MKSWFNPLLINNKPVQFILCRFFLYFSFMFKNQLLSFLLVLCSFFIFSQKKIKSDTLKVNYIGQKEGLLQLNVIDIEQDDLGYLWLATQDGLHRFNSNEFKVYLNNPQDSLSIPDDQLRDFHIANDTLFAISNTQGAFGLKLSTNSFFKIYNTPKKSLIGYQVFQLGNKMLFSLSNLLIQFDRVTKKLTKIQLPKEAVENYVNEIVQLNEEEFLLATNASGLLIFNANTLTLKDFLKVDESSHNTIIRKNKYFVVGTNKGVYFIDEKFHARKKLNNWGKVNCFYQESPSSLLIGTQEGVLQYDFISKKITKLVMKDISKKIYDPLEINVIKGDEKGNIWFGTRGEGLLHYNKFKNKFKTIELKLPAEKSNNKISSYQFLPLSDSTLFIGSTYGVLKYHHQSKKIKHYKETDNNLIYTLKKDFNGVIWAGGYGSGLLKYNKSSDVFELSNLGKQIPDKDIVQITPISKTQLLIATWSAGIYVLDTKKHKVETFLINGKVLNRARTSFIDSKGQIWLGAEEGAFCLENDGEVVNYTTKLRALQISGDRIFGIAEDSKGNIWLGTNVGLTKLDLKKNKSTLYFKQKGLLNDFIYKVLIDERDDIWVSTNKGISVLDTSEDTFTNFLESDGLQNNEFNGKAGYKDAFGNFYFGGIVGVNIFNPLAIKENPFESEIHIESLELFNSKIHKNELFKDTLKFKSDENVLTINYNAINYLNPRKVSYSYIMEGFDKDWRAVTQKRSTTYTNLNPGSYVFKVRATNDTGIWNRKEDTLSIVIIPPWYKTTAFKITSFLLMILFVVLFYLLKTRKLKKDKIALEAIIKQRTGEVLEKNEALEKAYLESEKQKNNIKFLMRELKHRVKNNLQIISSLLNIQAHNLKDGKAVDALKVAKNRILTISHLEDKMESDKDLIELKEFTIYVCDSILNVLSGDNNLKFKIKYSFNEIEVKNFNTVIYGLILNEMITNTVKYAFNCYKEENLLEINLFKSINKLTLEIKDNGKGYDQSQISKKSLGLDLVKDMVSQLNGEIKIISKEGVHNIIRIPLKE